MNPDLHQLRRDLGLNVPTPTQALSKPTDFVAEAVHAPAPAGISMNSAGVWLLAILGIALALWLLGGPICMFLSVIWECICGVVSFIFSAICWIIGIGLVLSVIAAFTD